MRRAIVPFGNGAYEVSGHVSVDCSVSSKKPRGLPSQEKVGASAKSSRVTKSSGSDFGQHLYIRYNPKSLGFVRSVCAFGASVKSLGAGEGDCEDAGEVEGEGEGDGVCWP